jgi:hypothetical protein
MELTPPRFLDLVHHYILTITDSERHNELNASLIGPSRINRPSVIDEQAGFVPPAWWKGDDYASRSGMTAMMSLKHQQ